MNNVSLVIGFTIICPFINLIFILINFVLGQKITDQNFICSQTKSLSRTFLASSSLTEDQSKIDDCNSQILKFINEKNIEVVDR